MRTGCGVPAALSLAPARFTLLDRREVAGAETWAHVAVTGDQVFVRELKAISAFRWAEP